MIAPVRNVICFCPKGVGPHHVLDVALLRSKLGGNAARSAPTNAAAIQAQKLLPPTHVGNVQGFA